jgi:hypothetical protein
MPVEPPLAPSTMLASRPSPSSPQLDIALSLGYCSIATVRFEWTLDSKFSRTRLHIFTYVELQLQLQLMNRRLFSDRIFIYEF